jgi:predicted dehydrogenase
VVNAIRLAIVGLGKIAREQHIPAIAGTEGIELAAIASRNASIDGIARFATFDELRIHHAAFACSRLKDRWRSVGLDGTSVSCRPIY